MSTVQVGLAAADNCEGFRLRGP